MPRKERKRRESQGTPVPDVRDVVDVVVDQIADSGVFPSDNGILRRGALVVSELPSDDPDIGAPGGIWHVSLFLMMDLFVHIL